MLLPPRLRVVRRAVEQELVGAVRAAVDVPRGDRAVVERPLPDRLPAETDARHQPAQHERIASVDGQFMHTLVVDDAAAVGVGGFEQRRLRRHRDLLGEGADLERDIDRHHLVDAERQTGAVNFLKPGASDRHAVGAGTQEGRSVVAGAVGQDSDGPDWFPGW